MNTIVIQGVYKTKNRRNGKIYIGSSVNTKRRWRNHRYALRNGQHHNPHLQRAWDKYGEDVFEFTVVEVIEDPDLRLAAEQKWLGEHFTQKACYNIVLVASAPMQGRVVSEETRRKISEANCGYQHTEEAKRKISAAQVGHKRFPNGRSEETKRKISRANMGNTAWNKGKPWTESTKRKISQSLMGRKNGPHSEETKRKIGQANKGRKPWSTGKHHSEETKQKISEALKGKASWCAGKKRGPMSKEQRQKLSLIGYARCFASLQYYTCLAAAIPIKSRSYMETL